MQQLKSNLHPLFHWAIASLIASVVLIMVVAVPAGTYLHSNFVSMVVIAVGIVLFFVSFFLLIIGHIIEQKNH